MAKIIFDVTWDIDDDIQYDLNSDDEDMREIAETHEDGLSEEYFDENFFLFKQELNLDKDQGIFSDFNDEIFFIETDSIHSTTEAQDFLKNTTLNFNEGPDGEYIQLWSYFQLINFRLVDDSGEEHSFNVYAE